LALSKSPMYRVAFVVGIEVMSGNAGLDAVSQFLFLKLEEIRDSLSERNDRLFISDSV
jgi:hypothetical protein